MMKRFNTYCDRKWTSGARYEPNVDPSITTDIIGENALANAAQTLQATRTAEAAASDIQARFGALDFNAAELLERKQEFGKLLSREKYGREFCITVKTAYTRSH